MKFKVGDVIRHKVYAFRNKIIHIDDNVITSLQMTEGLVNYNQNIIISVNHYSDSWELDKKYIFDEEMKELIDEV